MVQWGTSWREVWAWRPVTVSPSQGGGRPPILPDPLPPGPRPRCPFCTQRPPGRPQLQPALGPWRSQRQGYTRDTALGVPAGTGEGHSSSAPSAPCHLHVGWEDGMSHSLSQPLLRPILSSGASCAWAWRARRHWCPLAARSAPRTAPAPPAGGLPPSRRWGRTHTSVSAGAVPQPSSAVKMSPVRVPLHRAAGSLRWAHTRGAEAI